jgi:hypothetical protein
MVAVTELHHCQAAGWDFYGLATDRAAITKLDDWSYLPAAFAGWISVGRVDQTHD